VDAPLFPSKLAFEKGRDVIQAHPRGSSEKELRFATAAATHANDCIRHPSINIKHLPAIALFLQEKPLIFYF